jgi:steroid 5-alpha reductase family enzyme
MRAGRIFVMVDGWWGSGFVVVSAVHHPTASPVHERDPRETLQRPVVTHHLLFETVEGVRHPLVRLRRGRSHRDRYVHVLVQVHKLWVVTSTQLLFLQSVVLSRQLVHDN